MGDKLPATRVEEVEIPGKGKGWKYSDGSVRAANGHLLKKPSYPALQAAAIVTSEQAREMHQRRVTLSQERTRQGIADGLGIDLSKASAGQEWQTLTRLFVEQFSKSKNLRGMAESYEKLGRASGYIRPEQAEMAEAQNILAGFARMVEGFLNREVIEGKVKDG